jgi:ABC-type uncharacterized transport system permease subunit
MASLGVDVATWIAASLRSATPLAFVLLGETLTQRSGIINLGSEGEMLMGACVGFAVAAATGDPALGLVAGGLAASLLASVHAGLCVGAGANQVGSGLAVWILGLGLTSYFGRAIVGGQVTPFPPLADTGAGATPVTVILSQLTVTSPMAIAACGIAGVWLFRTRGGLALRTVGESAEIARSLGLRPALARIAAILMGGFLAGVGGAALSVDYTQTWAQDMTKGKGLVAVGLVIVARWNPFLVVPVALFFGASETAVLRLQAEGVAMSSYLLAAMPYLLAIAVMLATRSSARSTMPADLSAIFR